jgi:hypothetical protein
MSLLDTMFRKMGKHGEEAKYFGLMGISKAIKPFKAYLLRDAPPV